ncbi:hypothetical protein [Tessaracoccus coleopterorum]|uniref:hypothetical protein n=1 Tax=Tessaracoccus coleopterorum TaxID=2714950 RepID=UPI0018D4A671|nr:hypothetical protein [Tessaracoccus coleopterorum]
MLGGGPRVVRAGAAWFDKAAAARLTVINGGLLLWLLPLPSWAKVTVSTVGLVALAAFVPILIAGTLASVRERRRIAAGEEPSTPVERRSAFTGSGLVAGVAALALALSVGFGIDPGAAGLTGPERARRRASRPPARRCGSRSEPSTCASSPARWRSTPATASSSSSPTPTPPTCTT